VAFYDEQAQGESSSLKIAWSLNHGSLWNFVEIAKGDIKVSGNGVGIYYNKNIFQYVSSYTLGNKYYSKTFQLKEHYKNSSELEDAQSISCREMTAEKQQDGYYIRCMKVDYQGVWSTSLKISYSERITSIISIFIILILIIG